MAQHLVQPLQLQRRAGLRLEPFEQRVIWYRVDQAMASKLHQGQRLELRKVSHLLQLLFLDLETDSKHSLIRDAREFSMSFIIKPQAQQVGNLIAMS
jgi:hypothetical protein